MRPAVLFAVVLLALPAGAAEVRNSNRPPIAEWDFSPRLVWSVDQAGGKAFERPGELRILEDGTSVFHDFDAHVSHIFAPDGKHVCAFAAQGKEPGQVPFYLNCFISGDEIVIGAPSDLHFFGRDGRFAAAYPNNLFDRFPIAFVGDRVALLAPGNPGRAAGGVAPITRVDFSTGMQSLFDAVRISTSGGDGAGGPVVVVRGLTPTIEAAWDPSVRRLYYGCTSDSFVRMAAADGESLGVISLERPRLPVDEAAKRRHFAGSALPKDRIDAMVASLPNRLTHFRQLWAGSGLLYVLPPRGLEREVTAQPVDIFSADGRHLYRAELRLPGDVRFSPDATAIVGRDLYALGRDAQDRWSLRRYSISVPDAKQDKAARRR